MNRKSFEKLASDLEAMLEKKNETLDNANDADSPNDERINKLEEEIALIEEMADLVDQYINLE